MSDPNVQARRAELEARRAARAAEVAAKREAQELVDLEAFVPLEEQYGASNVSRLEIGFNEGQPVRLVVRCPNDPEMRRYRATVKPRKDGTFGDSIGAAEQLAAACRIYPARDAEGDAMYKAVGDSRPGVYVQLGLLALALAQGEEADEGKG